MLRRYERYLQMRVDKTAQGQAPKGYNTTLLEVRGPGVVNDNGCSGGAA